MRKTQLKSQLIQASRRVYIEAKRLAELNRNVKRKDISTAIASVTEILDTMAEQLHDLEQIIE